MALKVGYFVKESTVNLRRNLAVTVAATLTATVALLLVGGVLTLESFVGHITGQIESQVEVSVFLVDDITPEQQADVLQTIESIDVVNKVSYVSKDDAYEEFKELYKDQPEIWENITPDVLPASFRVSLKDAQRVDLIRSRLEGNPTIDEIVDQRKTVDRIVAFTQLLRGFSAIMVIILLVAAVFLITNTIQLAIHARRKEIEIMKLVGATNWFVRVPFMFEGIFQGLVGAILAMLLLVAGKSLVRGVLPVWIPTAPLSGMALGQIAWLAALGIGVGAIGSAVALRRFLDV